MELIFKFLLKSANCPQKLWTIYVGCDNIHSYVYFEFGNIYNF